MTLKIFTPKEINEIKEQEEKRKILRAQTLKETVETATTELNNLQATFEKTLVSQRLKYEAKETEYNDKLRTLRDELKTLEKNKADLLIPIDAMRLEADNKLKEANDLLALASQKQEENDDLAERLQEKLDETGEKLADLVIRENRILLKEKAVEDQAIAIKKMSSDLSAKFEQIYLNGKRN